MSVPPTGTVTFLFTDIEGSTKLWERSPESMSKALARHDDILRQVVEAYRGFVFKTVGDAFCCAFPTATEALRAALLAQQALFGEHWAEEVGELRVRMALHTGAADERGGDYFGPPLNRVARVLSAGHGGQVLLSLATQDLVRDQLRPGISLRDLGERRLKDLARPERVFQLLAPNLPHEFPPLKTLEGRTNNLPSQPTPLIGRERELSEISDLVLSEGVGLITLTGPGGTGKTRLALQVAAELVDFFEHGVFFVELAAVTDPELVFSKIASVLGLVETGDRPLAEALAGFLRDKQMLLVLDNFEQVVEAASSTMEALPCPPLKVLVTSRISLRVYGEHEYAVPPLSVPEPGWLPDLGTLSQYEAVRLFIQRARAARADFEVTNDNAPAVAEICTRLDGLPLAIELAAARIKLLPPRAMLARLGSRLRLLTGGARDLPERQRTLRGTIEWSHELLEEHERVLFRRLAVFAGGRTLEAVEEICDANQDLSFELLDEISSLVDKSLLRQEDGPEEEPRFVMLETIHEYAREKLEESWEAEEIRRLHAEYFVALAEEGEPELKGPTQAEWLERLEAEHDNLRAALAWLIEGADPELGLRLAVALWWFWFARGHLSEGRRWLDNALVRSAAAASGRAAGLIGAGRLAAEQGDREGEVLLEESVRLFRASADERGLATALHNLGWTLLVRGDSERAAALQKESLSLFRKAHDGWGVAETLSNLGIVAEHEDDADRAKMPYEESLVVRRKLGDKRGIGSVLNNLGGLTLSQGDPDRAASLLEEGVTLSRELGDKEMLGANLNTLGIAETLRENFDRARALFEESLILAEEIGHKALTVQNLLELAGVAGALGAALRAARLFGATDESYHALATYFVPSEQERHDSLQAAARAGLSEEAWKEACAEGRTMSMDDAVSYALQDDRD